MLISRIISMVVRFFWKLTPKKKIFSNSFSPKIKVFFCEIPQNPIFLNGLITAYQRVFKGPPWNEDWSRKEILVKLKKEVQNNSDSFLVLLKGSEQRPVEGFTWGEIVDLENLEEKIEATLGFSLNNAIEKEIQKRGKKSKILYFNEIGILPEFRKKLNPIRFLLYPGFQFALDRGVKSVLFWSKPKSKIVPLSLYFGFEKLNCDNNKQIVFLFNSDFSSFLEVLKHARESSVQKGIEKIIWVLSIFKKNRNKAG